ncbi:MAG: hypothetical protein ACKV2T_04445 [Kofleriaceae bacterium]
MGVAMVGARRSRGSEGRERPIEIFKNLIATCLRMLVGRHYLLGGHEAMSELAFNINGEPFELPGSASGWRVRRLKQKGAPEVVYGRDGIPLVLSIDAGLDDLRVETGAPGRYRLDPIDEAHRPIANAQAAYVFVHADARPAVHNTSALPAASDNVVIEAMRMNAEIAKSVVDRFPQMVEAAASLLRAADGAGLPKRERSTEVADDDEDDDASAPPPAFDLNALVAQIVPMLVMGLANGKAKLPDVASVLDWRKASAASRADKALSKASAVDVVPDNATDVIPPIDPETMTHFIAIQSALKPEEAALAREVAGNLRAAELHAWFDELKKLTVPQAVQKIRVLIAGNTEAVS